MYPALTTPNLLLVKAAGGPSGIIKGYLRATGHNVMTRENNLIVLEEDTSIHTPKTRCISAHSLVFMPIYQDWQTRTMPNAPARNRRTRHQRYTHSLNIDSDIIERSNSPIAPPRRDTQRKQQPQEATGKKTTKQTRRCYRHH